MKKLFSNWGAVIILALMFVGSWLGQWVFQWAEYASEQESHGQPAEVDGFIDAFLAATFENWQSEFLQLVFQAILIAAFGNLLFRADHGAGKEDIERVERKLDRLLRDNDA